MTPSFLENTSDKSNEMKTSIANQMMLVFFYLLKVNKSFPINTFQITSPDFARDRKMARAITEML